MTTEPALACAEAVLSGEHPVPGTQTSRAAAHLGRQALEEAVDELCGPDLRRANMRSRLIVLRHLHGDVVADLASTAWGGLSRACHHHAYELAPTTGEIRHLLDRVRELHLRTIRDS